MSRRLLFLGVLLTLVLASAVQPVNATPDPAVVMRSEPLVIDHRHTDLSQIPDYWIGQAKALLQLSYGHTSHGSQLVSGMRVIYQNNPLFSYNTNGSLVAGVLSLADQTPSGDLGDGWAALTRSYLNGPGGSGPSRNLVMWAWCGQVSEASSSSITTYLNQMTQLENDFPGVQFVYMTGHLDGTGESGNLKIRNQQIRDYVLANNKILFDFADIESYDPDGNYYPNADDNCTWCNTWCANHDCGPLPDYCSHSHPYNCMRKGYAFWWMMARLAGWPGTDETPDNHTVTFNANGGSGTMTPQTANSPTALKANTFTRAGYTFSGWNTAANGSGTAYNDGATYTFDADVTLYAQWTIASFNPVSKWTSAFDLSHGWTVQDYVRTLGDVNGDGLDDAVGFGLDGVYVALSNGTGFDAVSKWTSAFDLSHGWTVAQYVRTVGDVNGDGRADLVGFGLDGVYVALSTGSGFGAATKWTSAFDLSHGWTVAQYVRTVGDVNGDDLADLIGFGLDGVYVALSNGSGFGKPSKWLTNAFDLSHGWTVAQYVRTVGDVDGDGQADLIGFGLDGVYVALSTGTGFGAVSKWTSAFDLSHGWTVSQYVRTVGDMDGDGRADLVGFGLDGVYVALSNGSGFDAIKKWTSAFDLLHGWTVQDYVRTVGDVSGDGLTDLVGFGLDGVYVATAN